MILIFPQWQGVGRKNAIPQGAQTIGRLLKKHRLETVPVLPSKNLEKKHCICGYDSLLEHLRTATDKLQQEKPQKLFNLGGDCGSEIAPVAYLNHLYEGNLTVVWFDAHADLNTPESSASGRFHGMPLQILQGNGPAEMTSFIKTPLRPEQIILLGARDIDPDEVAFISRHKIKSILVDDIRADNIDIFQNLSIRLNIYIHVDIDVLDSAIISDSTCPTPNGLKTEELLACLRHLRQNYNVVGMSLTEYAPQEETQDWK